MKFRASIHSVLTFYKLVQSIEKLQKKCIIKFCEDDMRIICNSDTNEGGIQVWTLIKTPSIFTGYRIQSNSNNQITMSVSSEALLSALRASSSNSTSTYETDEIVLKLAKKNDHAVLSFEITANTQVGRRVKVEHDVKVEVMKASDVQRLREPMCPDPDAHIVLPSLAKIRTIIERLRPMSDLLSIRANNTGTLQISIRTDAFVGFHISSLVEDASKEDKDGTIIDRDQFFSVVISIKSFQKFLNSHVVSSTAIACICENHCIIIYVYVGEIADAGGVLTFYIPAIIDG
ncbi:cell cycle checkpoint [Flagelloscypha sp. PMI_526]|nr:cell cycle checkpoint [Flagelloscypha sp. PMI_526]